MITKTINIEGVEVTLKTSAALPRMYRDKFQADVFVDLNRVRNTLSKNKKELPVETLSIVENLAYCMAKHADPSITDDIYEWLGQFETTGIYKAAQEIILLWNEEQKTHSVPKK